MKATIREAFARQIRIEHAPPRTYFTDVEADNIDAPGPGSYQPALPEGKTSSFFPHPTEPSRVPRPEDDGPGPASYDPKPPPTIAYSLGSRAAFDTDKAVARTTAHESPGPAAYDIRVSEKLLAQRGSSLDVTDSGEHKCTFGIPRAKGGMVDVAIARAKLTPGPGQVCSPPPHPHTPHPPHPHARHLRIRTPRMPHIPTIASLLPRPPAVPRDARRHRERARDHSRRPQRHRMGARAE